MASATDLPPTSPAVDIVQCGQRKTGSSRSSQERTPTAGVTSAITGLSASDEFLALHAAVLAKDVSKLRHLLCLDRPGQGLDQSGSSRTASSSSNSGNSTCSSACNSSSGCQVELSETESALNTKLLSTLDAEGLTLMHQATFTKSVPILSALIEGGGDVNGRDEEGCTLLHTAAMVGNCLIAGWLLKEGANPAATDATGLLPIDRTEDCGMEDLLLSAMSLAGHANRRANFSLDLSEADDSDYATGSSSYGSLSEDEDGVLSLGSCAWQDEDEEVSEEAAHLNHGPFLTLEDFKPHSPERIVTRTTGEWSAQEQPSGNSGRTLCQVLACSNSADHYVPESASYDSDHESEGIPSFLTTLADGVRLWQQQTVPQSPSDDDWLAETSFHIEVVSGSPTYVRRSHLAPRPVSGLAIPLPSQDYANAHSWSKIHREVILTGFQIITKRNAELLQRSKQENRQAACASSQRHGALVRWATVSESDLGWVMPKSSKLTVPILRHRSLYDNSATSPRKQQQQQQRQRKRRVTFPSHVVFKDAVTTGNTEEVGDMVESGEIDVNELLPSGQLPLHLAASNRQRSIAQVLLVNGANVDGRDLSGWTPLHTAAEEGTVPLTNLLLEHNANPMSCNDRDCTPLMLASNPNVRLVLQNASRDAMSRAVKQRQALQETANLLDDDESSACSESEDAEEEDYDSEVEGEVDLAPGQPSTVQLVVSSPILELSLDEGRVSDIEDLEDTLVTFAGCDIDGALPDNPTDEQKLSCACHADSSPEHGPVPVEEVTEASPPSSPPQGPTTRSKGVHFSPCVLLRHAILSKDTTEVQSLLSDFTAGELGLNRAELSGVTAVHQAVLEEAGEVLHLLLTDGRSNVNARDADGWTPLHAAAAVGNKSILSLLLKCGAQATLLSDDGKFPIELAEDVELEGMLRQAMHTDF